MNTKKTYFINIKTKIKPRTPMNRQHIHSALAPQKSVALYFKDEKTEETFSSQDQKLVETSNL